MTAWQPQRVVELLLAAGGIALEHYERPRRDLKRDGSLVTQADTAIEQFLTRELEAPARDCYLLGEETAEAQDAAYFRRALAGTMYVVDPIDGTAPYAHHVPVWGVSLGCAQAGVLTDGAVYLPVTGELFITTPAGVELWRFPAGARAAAAGTAERLPPAATGPLHPGGLIAISQLYTKSGTLRLPNPLHTLCCAVVPLTYLLLGRYELYLADLKLWDAAGAIPMLARLGYEMGFRDGRRLTPRLSEDWLRLGADDPQRWKLRGTCLFGRPGLAPAFWPLVHCQRDQV